MKRLAQIGLSLAVIVLSGCPRDAEDSTAFKADTSSGIDAGSVVDIGAGVDGAVADSSSAVDAAKVADSDPKKDGSGANDVAKAADSTPQDAGPWFDTAAVDTTVAKDAASVDGGVAVDAKAGDTVQADAGSVDTGGLVLPKLDYGCSGGAGWARHIAVGTDFACATTKDGVVCWGNNNKEQLGSTSWAKLQFSNKAMAIKWSGQAVDIAASDQHACIAAWGKPGARGVWCWGENFSGQVAATGSTSNQVGTPFKVAGPVDAIGVAAGHDHSCAVTAAGEVWCWGRSWYGQLGDKKKCSGQKCAPVKAIGIHDAVAVAAGEGITCAVRKGNGLMCWGKNDKDLLGVGDLTSKVTVPTVVPGLPPVAAVGVGNAHVCTAGVNNQVHCWGYGLWGALGLGDTSDKTKPTLLTGIKAHAIAAGRDHNVALTPGNAVLTWGDNDYGEIGPKAQKKVLKPIAHFGMKAAVAIDTGDHATCAIDATCSVYCWGSGSMGQLGDGLGKSSDKPVKVVLK